MRKYLLLLIFISFIPFSQAQDITYMYRLLLTDKGQSPYTVDQPLQFLSQKSIDRRNKQNIAIDQTDIPIDASYFNQVKALGGEVVAHSKWLQTITVKTKDSLLVNNLRTLPFVDTLSLVYRSVLKTEEEDIRPESPLVVTTGIPFSNTYGEALNQIAMHNGNLLHQNGYRGEGMTIAVMDGGFYNADCIDAFNQEQIIAVKNFSHITASPYRVTYQHGTQILSTMLANKQNVMVGTAPEAKYYLFCSEVNGEEFPVEEDYWISAIEYADSIGVDISTTSLGYTTFDAPEMNHTQSQLDGKTILISRAATMAAEKGILVFNAGGNEGNKSWMKISFPSDADKIITVGSVQSDSSLSSFTPYGPSADGRIKPDVMGMGTLTTLIGANGNLMKGNGTSNSTPIIAGLMACLWQALPDQTNLELIHLLQQSSNKYNQPENRYGYGIPDVFKAYENQTTSLGYNYIKPDSMIRHIGNYLLIDVDMDHLSAYRLTIYDVLGKKIEASSSLAYASFDVSHLSKGLYIAHLEGPGAHHTCKFIKR